MHEHKTIKTRILTKEITNCYFCPNNNLSMKKMELYDKELVDNQAVLDSSWCRVLKRTIEHPEEFIPDDCPLPVREYEYKVTRNGKELLG